LKTRPRYQSIRKVIEATHSSGPFSFTELLEETGLHRNTLGRTCKYLVAQGLLSRAVMRGYKGRGHHVEYSISDAYGKLPKVGMSLLLRSYQKRKKYRGRHPEPSLTKHLSRVLYAIQKDDGRFYRTYRPEIDLLKATWPELRSKLARVDFKRLVRSVRTWGLVQGAEHFLEEKS
jgi:DNA-binding HxlR family transcriptional regulator